MDSKAWHEGYCDGYCNGCARETGAPEGDFAGGALDDLLDQGLHKIVYCKGCGLIEVSPTGECLSPDCTKAGSEGHGLPWRWHRHGPVKHEDRVEMFE